MKKNNLKIYADYLKNLQGLAEKKISGLKFPEDDDFAFMGISTMIKQISHSGAILKLETHPDTNLIARSMLETAFLYLWVSLEPQERSKKYRGFALIHDWRIIQQKKLNEEAIPEGLEDNILAGLEYYGDLLKKKDKKGNPIKSNDPYHANWKEGKPIFKIFEEVIESRPGLDGNYQIYKSLCDWTHSSVVGLSHNLTLDPTCDSSKFSQARDDIELRHIYNTAFQSLLLTLDTFCTHASIDFSDADDVVSSYLKVIQ